LSVKTLAKSVGVGRFAVGTYTGDGAATQAITGIGFQPIVVIIYQHRDWIFRADMPAIKTDQDGAFSMAHDGGLGYRWQQDNIISLDADGFTVGDGTPLGLNMCNVNAYVYTYICFG